MQCPKCAANMKTVHYEEIEVDRCSACRGIWFDMLEHEDLKRLAGSEAIDTGAGVPGLNEVTRIQCPRCAVPLIHMAVAGQPHIGYEACTVCYGLYFDAGEFSDFREDTFAEAWRASFGAAQKPAPR